MMDAERVSLSDQNWAEMRKFVPHLYMILDKLKNNDYLVEEEMILVKKCVALVLLRCDEMVKEINEDS